MKTMPSLIVLVFLLLASQWSSVSGAASLTTSTRAYAAGTTLSMASNNNMVVIGDPLTAAPVGGNVGTGSFSISFYSYVIASGASVVSSGVGAGFTTTLSTMIPSGYTSANEQVLIQLGSTNLGFGDKDINGNVFNGFGYDVAIADDNTLFVSQASKTAKTGRVFVYEGNVTDFKPTQILIPWDGKHRQDSDAMFGESISAKSGTLAVGCQQCNTTAPVKSGAVYVYKPVKGGWSESQVLTVDDMLFLGERVAIHEKVLIAAGDDKDHIRASLHDVDNFANTVVIFEEGPDGKFDRRQEVQARSGGFFEGISSIAVFDETIAIASMGSDTAQIPVPGGGEAYTGGAEKVYIFYPKTKRYGLESKPGPKQWTQIQILQAAGTKRYVYGNSYVSLSQNNLQYVTGVSGTGTPSLATSARLSLSSRYAVPSASAEGGDLLNYGSVITSDSSGFWNFGLGGNAGSPANLGHPIPAGKNKKCITVSLQDQFKDGWGIAYLLVEGPNGSRDKLNMQCTTANPQVYLYCPESEGGLYRFRIENGEETPFGWEIHWKVAANGIWYRGDRHTKMDFVYDDKYGQFEPGAMKGVLPLLDTCKICSALKPEGKHRSLSNLRALHHKHVTSSPTMSRSPTLAVDPTNTDYWNQFRMSAITSTTTWFQNDYNGAYFWVSSADGKKLFHTGTSCTDAFAAPILCWLELPDGDYKLRVGKSVQEETATNHRWQFCGSKAQIADQELSFTVRGNTCYTGVQFTASNKCMNTYKSAYWLKVEVLLGGGSSTLSNNDERALTIAVTETLHAVLGSSPSEVRISGQTLGSGGVQVSLLLEFPTISDTSALDNLVRGNSLLSSASNLLKYELVGSHALVADFMHGQGSSVTVVSVQNIIHQEYVNMDESSFELISDHVWMVPAVAEPSRGISAYMVYIAEGSYVVLAVVAVLALSFFVKRMMTKTVVPESSGTKPAPSVKPKFVATDLEILSDESSGNEDSDVLSDIFVTASPSTRRSKKRVNLSALPKRDIHVAEVVQLMSAEDDISKKSAKKNRKQSV